METELLPTHTPELCAAAVNRAAAALARGEPVALPTETVYGLAADALQPEAVAKIFEAKERPFFDPLIVHLPDRAWLERLAEIPEASRPLVTLLIERFWPGPLTLVLPRRSIVPDMVTAGLDTVALRMSAHPVFRAVLSDFGRPLAAPSANRFGRISPTAAEHVRAELDGRIPLILDGGPTEHGLESTIVKVDGTRLQVLRAGPITPENLVGVWKEWWATRELPPEETEVTGFFADLEASYNALLHGGAAAGIEVPGQLKSHYAPRTPLRLLQWEGEQVLTVETTWLPGREGPARRVGLLGWGRIDTEDYGRFAHVEWLSETHDLREAATTLFAKMRRLDEAGLDLIFADLVPEQGLGIAIMDRLRKAAAEHE